MQKGKKEDGVCLARTRRHEFESSQEDQNTTNQPERTIHFIRWAVLRQEKQNLMKGCYRPMTKRLTDIITEIRQDQELAEALKALCHFIRSAELPAEIAAASWAAAHPQGGIRA